MRQDEDFRIARPRQIYVGSPKRTYVSVADRG
jgi:citrate synthase